MLGGDEQCWVCQDGGKIAQNTQPWHSLYCAYRLCRRWGIGGVGAGHEWGGAECVKMEGNTHTHTHTHTHTQSHKHVHNTCNSFSYVLYVFIFSYVHSLPSSIPPPSPSQIHLFSYELYILYIRIFSYIHSPPLFNLKHDPPLSPLLARVDSGLLSSFFSYNWLMSSDQLQTTKPSPPTDGKVLRTALKCVEVRLHVYVFVH